MTTFNQIALKIIKEQERIIGPIAWSEARKVSGIKIVNEREGLVEIEGAEPMTTIDRLVTQYEKLFGRASHEVCREAASHLIIDLSPAEIPVSLR